MGTQYASVLVPTWVLRAPSVVDLLQSKAGSGAETSEDQGLLRLAWQIAWNGELHALVLALHEHEIPYDFFIENGSGLGIDQRGYWRPGMDEPHIWSEIDGNAFVWVSSVREVCSARGTAGQRLRAVAVKLDEAEPVVPDLRAFPDPRARRAEDLRSVVDGRSAMRSTRRR